MRSEKRHVQKTDILYAPFPGKLKMIECIPHTHTHTQTHTHTHTQMSYSSATISPHPGETAHHYILQTQPLKFCHDHCQQGSAHCHILHPNPPTPHLRLCRDELPAGTCTLS